MDNFITNRKEKIRRILEKRPRDLLLFELVVQTGTKISILLDLKVNHLHNIQVGDEIPILKNFPNGSVFTMNKTIHEAFNSYFKKHDLTPKDYLFKSKKTNEPLKLSTVSNMIKKWMEDAEIKDSGGARFLYRMRHHERIDKQVSIQNIVENIDSTKLLEPVQNVNFQNIIYQRLFEAIVSGKIPPGTKLIASQISKKFNVSQTPVRGALNRLEASGFVIPQKKRASIVKELSLSNIREIMNIRLALEIFGIELACRIRSEETLIHLKSLLTKYESTYNIDEFQEIHNQFHQTLCADAKMPLLQQLIRDMCNRVNPYFVLLISNLKNLDSYRKTNFNFHWNIYEEMRRGNTEKVSQYLREDLTQSITRLDKILQQQKKGGLDW